MKAAWVGDNVGWWLMRHAREYAEGNGYYALIIYNCWLDYIFGRPCPYDMPPEVRTVADCLRRAMISNTRFWFEAAWRCLPEDVRRENEDRDLKWDSIHGYEPDI